jgi:hypothetical protein
MTRPAAVLLIVLSSSCSVDTELGVAAEIRNASVTVAGTGADAAASVMLDVQFRVGAHALGPRTFVVPRADIRVGETPAATVNLDIPAGFDGTLSPGETQDVTLVGTTTNPDADAALCSASSATVVIQWEHRDAMDPSTMGEIDVAEIETTNITCM